MGKYKVTLLDGEVFEFDKKGQTGGELLNQVIHKMMLHDVNRYGDDRDYYGLSYTDFTQTRMWLAKDKSVEKQIRSDKKHCPDLVMKFRFYPPSHESLHSGYSMNMLVLQVRRDILNRVTPCTFSTLAVLGSYAVQSEIGDYRPEFDSMDYLAGMDLSPYESRKLVLRVRTLHKGLVGMSGSDADVRFLEVALKLAEYGIRKYPVRDAKGKPIQLGIASSGLYVYDGYLRAQVLRWYKIVSISEKRGHICVKWKEEKIKTEPTVEQLFKCSDQKEGKHILQMAKEEHHFFRLKSPSLFDDGTSRWRMSTRRGDDSHKERRQRERGTSVKTSIFDEPDDPGLGIGTHHRGSTLSIVRRGYDSNTLDQRDRRLSPSSSTLGPDYILQPSHSLPGRQSQHKHRLSDYDGPNHRRYNSYGMRPSYGGGTDRRDSMVSGSEYNVANDRLGTDYSRRPNNSNESLPYSPPATNGHGSLARNDWAGVTTEASGKFYQQQPYGQGAPPLTNGHSYNAPTGRLMKYQQKTSNGLPGVDENSFGQEVNNNMRGPGGHPLAGKQYSGGSGSSTENGYGPGVGGYSREGALDSSHRPSAFTPPRVGSGGPVRQHQRQANYGGSGDVPLPRFFSDSAGVSLDGVLLGRCPPFVEKSASVTRYGRLESKLELAREHPVAPKAVQKAFSTPPYLDIYDPRDDRELFSALRRVIRLNYDLEVDQIEIKKSV